MSRQTCGFKCRRFDQSNNHDKTEKVSPRHPRLTVVVPGGRMSGSATADVISLSDPQSYASVQRGVGFGELARIVRPAARSRRTTPIRQTTMPENTTTITRPPEEKLFFSNAVLKLCPWVAPTTLDRRVSVYTAKAGHLRMPGLRGGGRLTPSPASQHTAVSGGVWNTRLTADCCEQGVGGGRDA